MEKSECGREHLPVISRTDILCILDRSGSMEERGTVDEAIKGLNNFLRKQKKVPEEAHVSILLFDDVVERLWDRKPIDSVRDVLRSEWVPRGLTALYDAVGDGLVRLLSRSVELPERERPNRTMVVIVSDGMDNASRRYRAEDVRHLVEKGRALSWRFLFLCSDLGGLAQAAKMGLRCDEVVSYQDSLEMGRRAFQRVEDETRRYRLTGETER